MREMDLHPKLKKKKMPLPIDSEACLSQQECSARFAINAQMPKQQIVCRDIKRYHPNTINKVGTSDVHLSYPLITNLNVLYTRKNLIISCSVCKLKFSNPRVANNHFTTNKGLHTRKDTTSKANTFKTLLNYDDTKEAYNTMNNTADNSEGLSNLSRQHPVADLYDTTNTTPRTSSPSRLSGLTPPSPVNQPDHILA